MSIRKKLISKIFATNSSSFEIFTTSSSLLVLEIKDRKKKDRKRKNLKKFEIKEVK
jgi:hypothetical protein